MKIPSPRNSVKYDVLHFLVYLSIFVFYFIFIIDLREILLKLVSAFIGNFSVIEHLADEMYKEMYKTACWLHKLHAWLLGSYSSCHSSTDWSLPIGFPCTCN